jgi:hypothetical protein
MAALYATALEQIAMLTAEHAALKAERETLELKLAACGVASFMNTTNTIKDRIAPGHPYWSASYGDVCRAVDREMELRAENVGLKTILELLKAEQDEARAPREARLNQIIELSRRSDTHASSQIRELAERALADLRAELERED